MSISMCVCVCVCVQALARPALPPAPLLFPVFVAGRDRHRGEGAAFHRRPPHPTHPSCEKAGTPRPGGCGREWHGPGAAVGTPGQGTRGRVWATRTATGLCCGEVAPSAGHGPGRESRRGGSPPPPPAARCAGHSAGAQRTRTSAPPAIPAPFPGSGRGKAVPPPASLYPQRLPRPLVCPMPLHALSLPHPLPLHPLSARIRYTQSLGMPRPQRQFSLCSAALQPVLPPAPRGIPCPGIPGMLARAGSRRAGGWDPGGGRRRRRGRDGLHPGPRPT